MMKETHAGLLEENGSGKEQDVEPLKRMRGCR